MSGDLALFSGMPAALLNAAGGANAALGDGISGGSVNRLSLKGQKFRIIEGGQEVDLIREDTISVVLLAAQPKYSRVFYLKPFDEDDAKARPDCYSNDGELPAKDSPKIQSTSCATCPQNQKGSAKQGEGKACAYKKRLIIARGDQFADPEAPLKPYIFDVNGMSMFGEGKPTENLFSLGGYARWLAQPRPPQLPNGVNMLTLVTRVVMQEEKSVPCVLFGPMQNPDRRIAWLPTEQARRSLMADQDPEVLRLLAMSAVNLADAEGGTTPTTQATNTKGNQPMKVTPIKSGTGQHWIAFLNEQGAGEDDIEMIKAYGGPETSKGYKLLMASIEGDVPAGLNLSLEPPVAAAGVMPFAEWATTAGGLDAEDLQMIMEQGGPFEGRGAKLWAKLAGVEIPQWYHPGAASAAPARISWQTFAQTLDNVDEDDISMIEEAGGPSSPKGRKLWDRLIGVEIPEQVDLAPATDTAATPAPAPAPKPRGRKPAAAAPAPAPAPATPAPAPAPAASADGSPGQKLAEMFGKFD